MKHALLMLVKTTTPQPKPKKTIQRKTLKVTSINCP